MITYIFHIIVDYKKFGFEYHSRRTCMITYIFLRGDIDESTNIWVYSNNLVSPEDFKIKVIGNLTL